jgi:3-methylfumaryl-CoA hydratase
MSDLAALRQHIGRKVVDEDEVSSAPIRLMGATFDRKEADPRAGAEMPEGWHGLFFLPNTTAADLGPDGAPTGTGVIPAMPFPRRMAAGYRFRFHQPIHVGDKLRRETELVDVTIKDGSTGRLGFVTVCSRIYGPNGLCMEEDRDTAYREAIAPGASSKAPVRDAPPEGLPWSRTEHPDPKVLFRYSALTFNTHRIHYDADWARDVEGYPALVVHGPLTCTYLLHFVKDNMSGRRLKSFAIRARAPLFCDQPLQLVGGPTDAGASAWAATPAGTIGMSAEATFV